MQSVSLQLAGLVALADLTTIKERTILTGTASWLDILILLPGIYHQQNAADLAGGEFPACAAMTTGYPFRIENPATVYWLQRVSRTGHLTTVKITTPSTSFASALFPWQNTSIISSIAYLAAAAGTVVTIWLATLCRDWFAVSAIAVLMLARLINTIILRQRSIPGWKGAKEEGNSDLIVLLTQDRWARIQGTVNDTKLVTSGQWLRDKTIVESWFTAFAKIIVYTDPLLVANASYNGQGLIVLLLVCSAGLLALANAFTSNLQLFGKTLSVQGERKKYARRLDMTKELIIEVKTDEWAMRLGMIKSSDRVPLEHEKVTM
jgi:hypothetical protein